MKNQAPPPRRIDHCVLPVADLAVARRRLAILGFSVAPEGVHPFGTGNACVYFADGTFLEPLAVVDEASVERSAREGNVFTARDRAYRFRRGEEGFSALVLASDDADADHAAYLRAGLSAGKRLDFSRPFVGSGGKTETAAFRLAFACDLRAPDAFFFACQRAGRKADRSELERHENGALRIAEIVLSAGDPAAFSGFLGDLLGSPVEKAPDGVKARTANGTVAVLSPADLELSFGVRHGAEPGLLLHAIVFGVGDLDRVRHLLTGGRVGFERRGRRIVVPPAPGQGAVLAFEALP